MTHATALRAAFGALVLCLAAPALAQVSLSGSQDRWYFGGGLGAGFGDVTFVTVAPFAGYRVTDDFSVGAGLQYRYRHDDRFGRDLNTTDYGGSLFARHRVTGPFFVQGEYEYLSYQYFNSRSEKARTGVSSLLAGGGISQPLGSHASFFALALYNFSYAGYSAPAPYSSPWVIRFGVGIGF